MKKQNHLLLLLLLLAVLALGGCRAWLVEPTPTPAPETFKNDLLFTSQVTFTGGGNTLISLQVVNTSEQRFPGDEDFVARMEIRAALSNDLRASAEAYQLGPLAPGERSTLIIWEGPMEPGRYLLSWGAQDYSFTSTDFEVR